MSNNSQRSKKIHLYLLEVDNVAVNLSAALDARFKPDQITLCYLPEDQHLAVAQAQVLENAGIDIDALQLPDIHEAEHFRNMLLDWIMDHYDDNVALNASGGVRIHSLLANEVFHTLHLPVFYVDSKKNQLIWICHPQRANLYHEDRFEESVSQVSKSSEAKKHLLAQCKTPTSDLVVDLENHINFNQMISAMGVQVLSYVKNLEITREVFDFCDHLVKNFDAYENAISYLNYLASSANQFHETDDLSHHHRQNHHLMDMLFQLEKFGYLRFSNQKHISFKDEETRFFVNGGWLEVYTHYLLANHAGVEQLEIQEVVRGLEIGRKVKGQLVKNELDVALLANNKLYVIECKTKQYHHQNDADEVIYKLDYLQDLLGGMHCKAMLITLHPIPNHLLSRANSMNIEVCSARGLKDLSSRLRQWIQA